MSDYSDIEIYVRRPHNTKDDDEKYVWEATYKTVANLTNHTILKIMSKYELKEGKWEIGIREQGDEQYSQRFEITPLVEEHGSGYELQNHAATVLNHWRQ